MYRYVLYGLGIHSEVHLGDRTVDSCASDVTIRWRRGVRVSADSENESLLAREPDKEIRLSWPEIAAMSVREGKEIVIETLDDSEPNYVSHLVQGLGLGLLLHQRGIFTLHASAVALGDRAVAIAGPKGLGKSTVAAAMQAQGHRVLSDDVLALDFMPDGKPLVRSGPNVLNLWPDAARAIGDDPSELSRIWSSGTKLVRTNPANGDLPSVPLQYIFFLELLADDQASPVVEPMSTTEAFSQLVGHSHALRMIEDRQALPRHMRQCGQVLKQVDVFKLKRSRLLATLPAITELIEDYAGLVRGKSIPSQSFGS